VPTWHDFIDC